VRASAFIISNCVINPSAAKERVIAEAFRVLKPGGRFAVSDMVFLGDRSRILAEVIRSAELWSGCVSGALAKAEYEALLRGAGFEDVSVVEYFGIGQSRVSYHMRRLKDAGLVRSVAMNRDLRGSGLGVEAAYLLAETAERFFPHYGFRRVSRCDLRSSVRRSVDFTSVCPASARAMVLGLRAA
jgi:DNA-binding transcriptional ArsR family regulator